MSPTISLIAIIVMGLVALSAVLTSVYMFRLTLGTMKTQNQNALEVLKVNKLSEIVEVEKMRSDMNLNEQAMRDALETERQLELDGKVAEPPAPRTVTDMHGNVHNIDDLEVVV